MIITNGTSSINELAAIENYFECTLPTEYVDLMLKTNGGQFILDQKVCILWKASEIINYNCGYEVVKHTPNLVLFGSNGAGEAIAFDRNFDMRVVKLPFIGMDLRDAVADEGLIDQLTLALRVLDVNKTSCLDADKEIFFVKPIILGGSPTDPGNITTLGRDQHMLAVRYWNTIVAQLKEQA